jgi:hypothetical protein
MGIPDWSNCELKADCDSSSCECINARNEIDSDSLRKARKIERSDKTGIVELKLLFKRTN